MKDTTTERNGARDFTGGVSPDTGALLTAAEVAEILKVPVSWVYEHTRSDRRARLPCMKLGKYLRFFTADILDYLQSMRRSSPRRR